MNPPGIYGLADQRIAPCYHNWGTTVVPYCYPYLFVWEIIVENLNIVNNDS